MKRGTRAPDKRDFVWLEFDLQGGGLADQVRSLDWKARRAEVIGKAIPEVVGDTCATLLALVV